MYDLTGAYYYGEDVGYANASIYPDRFGMSKAQADRFVDVYLKDLCSP